MYNLKAKLKLVFHRYKSNSFMLFVCVPFFIFMVYQVFLASDRYESSSQIIVKQPDGVTSFSPEMALLGIAGPAIDSDAALVQAYIYSTDMLDYLNQKLNVYEHFTSDAIDVFSRLHRWDKKEDFLSYYKDKVSINVDISSNIITIKTQAFDSDFAYQLNTAIISRSEWFINNIAQELADKQLKFINSEHTKVENKLKEAQSELLVFQNEYNLLDPESEGLAFQKITYGLENEIAKVKTELAILKTSMSLSAPEVVAAQNQLNALEEQLLIERKKLSHSSEKEVSVGEMLARYSELKINVELALKSYASSLVTLEKTRVETYRKLKFLSIIETSTRPDSSAYPEILYNLVLLALVLVLLYGIGRVVYATIHELSGR